MNLVIAADMNFKVLDFGYIKFIEAWGTGEDGMVQGWNPDSVAKDDYEVGIIEAARMSTGKGFNGWEKDQKLLRHLYSNKHMTPFEMAGMTIEVSAPIMVYREWHRHRTQSYNEMSARYIALPDENYVPEYENLKERVRIGIETKNKQAQGQSFVVPDDFIVSEWLDKLNQMYSQIEGLYQYGLMIGIPRELARLPIPVGRYSRMRASANLRNWLQFLTLRLDPNAQWEIRQYATYLGEIIKIVFPRTWELFNGT